MPESDRPSIATFKKRATLLLTPKLLSQIILLLLAERSIDMQLIIQMTLLMGRAMSLPMNLSINLNHLQPRTISPPALDYQPPVSTTHGILCPSRTISSLDGKRNIRLNLGLSKGSRALFQLRETSIGHVWYLRAR